MANPVLDFERVNSSFGDLMPLPDTLHPVEKFDYHLLPDGAFAEHVKDISERMQCPPDYVAVTMMTTLGAVIGRSHQIRPKEFYKAKRDHSKKEIATLLKNKKPDEARAMIEAQGEIEPPVRRWHFTNDSTIEKLGELECQNPNGILVFRDEIHGFLRTIDSENRPNDRAFYLEGFNGTGSYQSDRIGRGTTDIENHVISLFGTIQPGRFASYIHSAIRQGSGDDGFSQRFQLAVYPDEPSNWTNVDRHPSNDAKNEVYSIIRRLSEKAEIDEPVMLRFSSEAQSIFNEWRDDLENKKLRNNDDHPSLIAHLAKYRSLLPSLALIIHLVDSHESEITPVSELAIIKACGWCDYLESHARRIYSDATNNPLKTAKLILNKIEAGKLSNGFNSREINRKGWSGLTDTAEIKEGIETLIDYGYLLSCVVETDGRTAITYRIHPKVIEGESNG